jgi:hypothetical protein
MLVEFDATARQWRAATVADLSAQLREADATPW